jgi:hypothetical protein
MYRHKEQSDVATAVVALIAGHQISTGGGGYKTGLKYPYNSRTIASTAKCLLPTEDCQECFTVLVARTVSIVWTSGTISTV